MEILKVISALMDYPTQELQAAAEPIKNMINQAREISPAMREHLNEFVQQLQSADLMDLQ